MFSRGEHSVKTFESARCAMREYRRWTIRLGEWRQTEFRLHAATLVLALLGYAAAWAASPDNGLALFAIGLGTWLLALLGHELGHLYALDHYSGFLKDYTLTPLGNLGEPELRREPQGEFSYALAGSAINFIMGFAAVVVLSLLGHSALELFLSPLQPAGLIQGSWGIVALKLFCWWNGVLLINLFPALPLDGGHALCAVLTPVFTRRGALAIVTRSMVLTAAGLFALALLLPSADEGPVPSWLALALFAVALLFEAFHYWPASADCAVRWPWGAAGNSAPRFTPEDDYISREAGSPGVMDDAAIEAAVEHDLAIYNASRLENEDEDEEFIPFVEEAPVVPPRNDDARLDEVLTRVNALGMAGLSPADREFLQQASRRLRARAGHSR